MGDRKVLAFAISSAASYSIRGRTAPSRTSRFGPRLTVWVALTVGLQGVLWLFGFRASALVEAVERGAERVESCNLGEVGDDQTRKAIETQRATLPFWTTLALIDDFAVEPLALVVRPITTAMLLSGVAALAGRPHGFTRALAACAAAQGYWVLGLAVRVLLMIALRSQEVETSLALALPPGTYPATTWVALRQLDVFTLLGWAAITGGAWRRGQANLVAALLVCVLLGLGEVALRSGMTLIVEAGMGAAVGDLIVLPAWEAD